MGRGRRRSFVVTEKQQKFARLIAQGVGNAEACRRVRVARSTGIYRRHGRTVRNTAGERVHHPPVHQLAPPRAAPSPVPVFGGENDDR